MKKLLLGLNIVLFIGLGVLYFLHFKANKSPETTEDASLEEDKKEELRVAYVHIDSVLLKYKLSVELNETITKRQSNLKSKLEKEFSKYEKDARAFQDKLQKGIFLTQQRAEQAQRELLERQQQLQELEYDYTNQLAEEQQQMNTQLFDSITNFINHINTPERFQIILGHQLGGNMLYGAERLNITKEVIEGLNSRYVK